MLICNTDQAKHDSNRLKKNWSILVIFQPLNVSQRKNPFFSLTARLGKISKIWKKRHKTGWFKTFSQNFRSVRCVSKALAALQHTYIHPYIHIYIRTEKLLCEIWLRFFQKMHIHPFYFYTDRYSTSNTTKYASYERWFIWDSHHS